MPASTQTRKPGRKTPSNAGNGNGSEQRIIAAPSGDIPMGDNGLMQIVQPLVRDRWLGLIRRNYTADSVRGVLDSTNFGGPLYALQAMFEMMEESWPRLGKNLHDIRTAVSRLEWIIQPYAPKGKKPTPSAQEKASFVEEQFWGMQGDATRGQNGVVDMVYDLMDAFGKGVAVLEIDWIRKQGGILGPKATRWIRSVYYDYPTNPDAVERLMLSPSGNPLQDLRDFPANKFMIGMFRWRSSNLAGKIALLRSLAPWWIFTNFSTEWLLQFGQIFGMPIRWATYRNKGDLKTVSEMLENMGAVSWGAFPEGTNLTLHDAAKSATENPNAFLLNYSDTLADIVVLGQTLTSNVSSSGGNRALGEVHERILSGRAKHAGYWAGEVMTSQLSRVLIRLNYGNEDEVPIIMPRIEDPKDPQTQAQAYKTIFVDMGLPVGKEWLYTSLGVPQPAEDDDLFEKPAPAPSPFGGLDAGPVGPGREPGQPPNNANRGGTPAREKAFAALDGLDLSPGVLSALDNLPDPMVVHYAEQLVQAAEAANPGTMPGRYSKRYRRGQPGGGRFMPHQRDEAMKRVRDIMAKWPAETHHRGLRHIAAFGMRDDEAQFRAYLTPNMPDEVDQRARAIKKTEKVPLKDLRTTQSRIDGEKVMAMLMSTADDSGQLVRQSPIVVKRSNMMWLWDGHHRAAKALALGQDTIQARVVDCEDLKK